jgi:Sigma 54 modulation/S30EA ribosomal protein C terminus
VALDLAFAKLEARLRRAAERRKPRRSDVSVRPVDALSAVAASSSGTAGVVVTEAAPDAEEAAAELAALDQSTTHSGRARGRRSRGANAGERPETLVQLPGMPDAAEYDYAADGEAGQDASGVVPIQMEGDGPLVVREKFHSSRAMTIDQALFQMELVGHDFYAYQDSQCGKFSVVYRRRGYDYGVIRLVEEDREF